jgi:predicted XRE-type DNA-binding protein
MGFTPEEAAILEFKLSLHNEIMKVVKRKKLTSRKLEEILDITQPKASELLNGKISSMTADRLTKYLHRLGRQVKVTTKAARVQHSEAA